MSGNGHGQAVPTRGDALKRAKSRAAAAAEAIGAPPVIEAPGPKGKKGKAAAKDKSVEVTIPPLETQELVITIRGITPLVVHRFSEKSRKQMEDSQQGAPRHKRAPKVPQDEFKASLYVMDEKKGKYGFPATGFKKAMVSACRYAEGFSMSKAYGAFHILGDLVEIKGAKPIMRTDVVRIGGFGKKTADIRYRGEFKDWKIDLRILYNRRIVSKQMLAHLLNLAGFSVGVGEWRPEKGGQFGMFEVASRMDDSN